jgi:hypothetical protein
MKKALLILSLVSSIYSLDINSSVDKKEINGSKKSLIEKNLLEQMKREEKYAKEQKFYQGKDYNLSAVEVNPDSLSSIKAIEPEYDFDMDDVYSD